MYRPGCAVINTFFGLNHPELYRGPARYDADYPVPPDADPLKGW
jgi:hypothetical protein